jgi:energy-coupling factor transporter ATP-binding protein EcfA2
MMRIHRVHIRDFKGVDAVIPWASAVVLFGPNDSGKTNILEAFLTALGHAGTPREEPSPKRGFLGPMGWSSSCLEVELDGLDVSGSRDQEIFLSWFLSANTAVSRTPWWLDESSENDEELDWQFSILDGLEQGSRDARHDFGRLTPGGDRPHAIAELVERVRDCVRVTWEALRAGAADLGAHATFSGAEATQGRRFLVGGTELAWLPPRIDRQGDVAMAELECTPEPSKQGPVIESFLRPLGIRVIRVQPASGGFAELCERLERLLPKLSHWSRDSLFNNDRDAWVQRQGGFVWRQPAMKGACAELSERVNDLLPQFVARSYDVEIVPLLPDQWHEYGGRHAAVRLRARGRDLDFDLDLASSGVSAWAGFALSEAMRMAVQESPPSMGAITPSASPMVYVLDEPEAHLHPLAQEEAAAWVAERVREGASVLLATHAVPFLRLPLQHVEYLRVVRTPEWKTTVEPTKDVMSAVAEQAEALGLPPAALIQLTRAWLVVEGEHDRMVLDAFYGKDLHQAGIRILPIRGAGRAKASFAALTAVAPWGMPFFYLLDNTRAEAVKAGRIAAGSMTEEERIAEQLWRNTQQKGVDVEILGLPYPDIICALPMEAVRILARDNGGKPEAATEWSDLIAKHERHRTARREGARGTRNFKKFVLESLGLDTWSIDEFVARALRACEGQAPPAGPLSQIVSRIVAAVDDRAPR